MFVTESDLFVFGLDFLLFLFFFFFSIFSPEYPRNTFPLTLRGPVMVLVHGVAAIEMGFPSFSLFIFLVQIHFLFYRKLS